MNNAKHTPGPWTVAYLDHNGQAVVSGEHSEICTCWHHCVGALEKKMHHNARLISAAPELYDALEKIVVDEERRAKDLRHREAWDLVKFSEDRLIAARSALNKASQE